jgi:hypothetical protein
VGLSVFDERLPVVCYAMLTSAQGTSFLTIVPVGSTIVRIDAVLVTSGAAAAHDLQLGFTLGSDFYPLGSASVAVDAGFTTVPAADLVAAVAPPAIGAILIPVGYALAIKAASALPSGQVMLVTSIGGTV